MTEQEKKLVDAVREHARKNYEKGGWDFVVECYEDDDILETINEWCKRKPITEAAAIRGMAKVVKIKDDHRRDIQGTAW